MTPSPFRSIDPTTDETFAAFAPTSSVDIDRVLTAASQAQRAWSQRSIEERSTALRAVATVLGERSRELAELAAREMGKPVAEGLAEVRKCAAACEYYASNGAAFLEPRVIQTDARRSVVTHEPLGVVLAIMPWNFPYWQVFRFVSAALMLGNGVIIKHAPNVPRCALAIEAVFRDAGLAPGLVQNVFVEVDDIPALLADDRIVGATLTGSTRAGRSLAKVAGAALKPVVLELGGNGPFLVLEDANLEEAAAFGIKSRTINCGQSCIAATRFIVARPVYNRFVGLLKDRLANLKVGAPLLEGTDLGPLVSREQRARLQRQVDEALATGGRLLLGGVVPEGPGAFYPPTLIVDVPRSSSAAREEIFGPVAIVIPFDEVAEAVTIANDGGYGLAASVWGADEARLTRIASELQVGGVFLNDFAKSDPRLPFGGIRESGFGRELGVEGLRSFANVKSIWLR